MNSKFRPSTEKKPAPLGKHAKFISSPALRTAMSLGGAPVKERMRMRFRSDTSTLPGGTSFIAMVAKALPSGRR